MYRFSLLVFYIKIKNKFSFELFLVYGCLQPLCLDALKHVFIFVFTTHVIIILQEQRRRDAESIFRFFSLPPLIFFFGGEGCRGGVAVIKRRDE